MVFAAITDIPSPASTPALNPATPLLVNAMVQATPCLSNSSVASRRQSQDWE